MQPLKRVTESFTQFDRKMEAKQRGVGMPKAERDVLAKFAQVSGALVSYPPIPRSFAYFLGCLSVDTCVDVYM
jgi:hypothetical protein